jgi:hypothetical protein
MISRKTAGRLTVLAAVIALIAPAHFASPAQASQPPITAAPDGDTSPDVPLQMCQASGTGCARDANNLDTTGNFVVTGTEITGPAENSRFLGNGSHLNVNGTVFQEGTLKFTGHTNLCIGTGTGSTQGELVTQPCAGGRGTIWLHGRANGADIWINRLAQQTLNPDPGDYEVLEGFDPGASVTSMIIVSYNNHAGFVRYEFR